MAKVSLASVEGALNGWLKPGTLGESWDNIGLLVGSGRWSKEDKVITGVLICNDLKPGVVEEAIRSGTNLVVAYHPPIFKGMKAIGYGSWKEQLIAKCLAHDISVYSPHTTLDSVAGGMNDAVVDALAEFGSADAPFKSKAIKACPLLPGNSIKGFSYSSSFQNVGTLCRSLDLGAYPDVGVEIEVAEEALGPAKVNFYSNFESSALAKIKMSVSQLKIQDFSNPKPVGSGVFGAGRIVSFAKTVDFSKVIDAVKTGLGLEYVQVAFAGKSEVRSAAICVGSGGSLLEGVPADVFITGEMSHHTILDCVFAGTSVILCNHCSSERHYLPKLASIVKLLTGLDHVVVSEEDKSPLSLSN